MLTSSSCSNGLDASYESYHAQEVRVGCYLDAVEVEVCLEALEVEVRVGIALGRPDKLHLEAVEVEVCLVDLQ